jgi:hypothetical protein
VTSFFLPGVRAGVDPDRAYDDLRKRTEKRTGGVARAARIYSLHARRDGSDSQTRVGESDPCTGKIVRAILATKDGYTVIWEGGHADVSKRQIYEVINFEP